MIGRERPMITGHLTYLVSGEVGEIGVHAGGVAELRQVDEVAGGVGK